MPDNHPPALLRGLDTVTALIGRTTAWLVLVMMMVQFAIVVMRYAFGIHSIALQESVMYMHAMVFMLGAAWTLQHNGHVRVDIFYRQRSPRSRAGVDLFGTLFLLLPVSFYILLGSLGYAGSSWAILERSPDGGIPGVFLLKSLIPVMATLLILQGIAQLIRQTLVRRGRLPSDTPRHEEES
uniref:TRAP transporter small permease subunit n=1 Tax=uncultured Halomonas sp. TaxID=173971 RepID=UPI0026165B58|nr:TRAP transporter small permease subunit [uncultured Halomonas sp.]